MLLYRTMEVVMKKLMILALLAAGLAPLTGCIVAPAPGPYHAHWVPGYYGPYGGYHPGHWS
jgi:hypothetical protein